MSPVNRTFLFHPTRLLILIYSLFLWIQLRYEDGEITYSITVWWWSWGVQLSLVPPLLRHKALWNTVADFFCLHIAAYFMKPDTCDLWQASTRHRHFRHRLLVKKTHDRSQITTTVNNSMVDCWVQQWYFSYKLNRWSTIYLFFK